MTDPISSLTAQTTAGARSTDGRSGTSSPGNPLLDNEDFSTFLGLLTAQLQYQDPMDPMNTDQFVTQLTQFSQLEQSVRGNDTLDAIRADLAGRGVQSDVSLIGRSVLTASNEIILGKDGATIRFEDVPAGETVEVQISDGNGEAVSTFPVTATQGETVVEWSGRTASGDQIAEGTYKVDLRRKGVDGAGTSPVQPLTFAAVTEVRLVGGTAELVLDGGLRIPASEVRAVR